MYAYMGHLCAQVSGRVERVRALVTRASVPVCAILAVCLSYWLLVPLWILEFFGSPVSVQSYPPLQRFSPMGMVWAVFLAPLLETWIFQSIPLRFFRRRGVGAALAVPISALIFGLVHPSSVFNMVVAGSVGLVFGWVFWWRDSGGGNPFWIIAIAHGIRNAIAIGMINAGI